MCWCFHIKNFFHFDSCVGAKKEDKTLITFVLVEHTRSECELREKMITFYSSPMKMGLLISVACAFLLPPRHSLVHRLYESKNTFTKSKNLLFPLLLYVQRWSTQVCVLYSTSRSLIGTPGPLNHRHFFSTAIYTPNVTPCTNLRKLRPPTFNCITLQIFLLPAFAV